MGGSRGALRGMAAGLVAAGVMSALRLVARRAGLIEHMIPQVLQERVSGEAGVRLPGGTAGQQLAAEAVHHAVGLTAGGVLGSVTPTPGVVTGSAFGLAIWLVDVLGLMPALRVRRRGGRAVDAVAHTLFGVTLAFAMRELAAQPRQRPVPREIPLLRRVG